MYDHVYRIGINALSLCKALHALPSKFSFLLDQDFWWKVDSNNPDITRL